jgi:hypothetical protein
LRNLLEFELKIIFFSFYKLKARHDLFRVGFELFPIKKDLLLIEIALDDTVTNSFIFALIPKKKEKIYRKTRYDLVRFQSMIMNNNLLITFDRVNLPRPLMPTVLLARIIS